MFTVSLFHISFEMWGALFCIIALFCVSFSYFTFHTEKRYLIELMILSALLLVSDAMAWYYRGVPGPKAYILVTIGNFMTFLMTDMILMVTTVYINYRTNLKKEIKRKSWYIYAGLIAAAIDMSCLFLSLYTHWYYVIDELNVYHRSYMSFMTPLCTAFVLAVNLINLIRHRRNMPLQIFGSLCICLILPTVCAIYQYFNYGISYANIALVIALINLFVTVMAEQGKNLAKETKQSDHMAIDLLLSQIGPHFIYNTLGTIKHLCHTDPQKAEETVDQFSVYLRGNIDSLKTNNLISFDQEMKHINAYFAVEKTRFGDQLNTAYDIEESDFLLPALTLQPIVENAVKHGICAREEGGTLTIKEHTEKDAYVIQVKDDGVGFDPDQLQNDAGKIHVGMDNVRERLQMLCNGTMTVSSEKGKGTAVTIMIPKKGDGQK